MSFILLSFSPLIFASVPLFSNQVSVLLSLLSFRYYLINIQISFSLSVLSFVDLFSFHSQRVSTYSSISTPLFSYSPFFSGFISSLYFPTLFFFFLTVSFLLFSFIYLLFVYASFLTFSSSSSSSRASFHPFPSHTPHPFPHPPPSPRLDSLIRALACNMS